MAKRILKTINRTGGKITRKSIVMSARAQSVASGDSIKRANEAVKSKKESDEIVEVVRGVDMSTDIGDEAKVKEVEIKSKYKLSIDAQDLAKAGCHIGHSKARSNRKSGEYVYGYKNNTVIFDLFKTIVQLEDACNYLHNLVRQGGKVVFVGTKRQAREIVKKAAVDLKMPYVVNRWLGGTISNWSQVKKSINKLNEIKSGLETGKYSQNTKKEISLMKKEVTRLEKTIGGLGDLTELPNAIFVVDGGEEKTAVKEAKSKGLKVLGIVDSDSDPGIFDYPISANDDNANSVGIILDEVVKSISGKIVKNKK